MLTVFAWVNIIFFLLVEKEVQHFLVQLEIRLINDKEKIYKISYWNNFCFGMPLQMAMHKFGVKREIKKIIFCSDISNAYFW